MFDLICQKHLTPLNHKPFDKFYHNFGIRGIPLQLFRYLSNRKQHVKVENVQSRLFDISKSVAQGSVLGPLSFIMHILIICLNPLHFILYYTLMILIFVYLIKFLNIRSTWCIWN